MAFSGFLIPFQSVFFVVVVTAFCTFSGLSQMGEKEWRRTTVAWDQPDSQSALLPQLCSGRKMSAVHTSTILFFPKFHGCQPCLQSLLQPYSSFLNSTAVQAVALSAILTSTIPFFPKLHSCPSCSPVCNPYFNHTLLS